MKHNKSLALALSLGLMTAFPTLAMADNSDEFETLMLQGINFYKKGSSDPGNFAKAIEKFEKAKAINPIPDVIYNIARANHLLGNYEKAYIAYCEYSLTSSANADSVKGYMDTMKSKLGASASSVTCNAELVKNGIPKPGNQVLKASDMGGRSFEDLMTKGIEYYKKGAQDTKNYAQAIEYFKAAKRIDPLPDVVYNIARSYHLMGDCENALDAYREYAMTSAANATKVKDFISSLSTQCGTKTGKLVLKCEPSHAVVSIDNAANVTCNGTHTLKAGDHSILVTAEGYEPETRKVSVSSNNIPTNLTVSMREFVVRDPEAEGTNDSQSAVATTEAGVVEGDASDSESRVITETADVRSGSFKPSKLFWSGVGVAGGGILMMMGGGIAMGEAHREASHSGGDHTYLYYERNSGLLAGGKAILGIGTIAALTGVALMIVDVMLDRSDDDNTQAVKFNPAITFGAESASAGFTMTF